MEYIYKQQKDGSLYLEGYGIIPNNFNNRHYKEFQERLEAGEATFVEYVEPELTWEEKRLAEYPSLQDCIHALLDEGQTLKDLQALRQEIKDKYPKD